MMFEGEEGNGLNTYLARVVVERPNEKVICEQTQYRSDYVPPRIHLEGTERGGYLVCLTRTARRQVCLEHNRHRPECLVMTSERSQETRTSKTWEVLMKIVALI